MFTKPLKHVDEANRRTALRLNKPSVNQNIDSWLSRLGVQGRLGLKRVSILPDKELFLAD